MPEIETDNTRRFTDRADYYAAFRPRYPDAVVAYLGRDAGLRAEAVIVDVGFGTGLSSEPFLRCGHAVIAVEPNEAMRHEGERRLRNYSRLRIVAGTAEDIPLADQCADAVMSASAFHWFDAAAARAEFRRILKPGGPAIVMGNSRRRESSPLMRAYNDVIQTFSSNTGAHQHRDERVRAFLASSSSVTSHRIDYQESLNLREFLGRTLSYSATPLAGQPGHDEMMRELERIFADAAIDGRVTYDGQITLHWSRLD
jgi:SAM-dependent methyltransferase